MFVFRIKNDKKENKYFHIAYYMSILLLFMASVIIIFFAIPFGYTQYALLLFVGFMFLDIILICIGFQYSMEKKYPIYIIIMYTLILFIQIKVNASIFSIFCLFVFIIILFSLLFEMKNFLIQNHFDFKLSMVRIDSWKFVLNSITIMTLVTVGTLYTFPFINYHYTIDSFPQYNHLKLLDTFEIQKENSLIKQYIYDYDKDYYLHIYDLQYNPNTSLDSIDFILQYSLSSRRYARVHIDAVDVHDENNHYQIKQKTDFNQNEYLGLIASYHVPLNPNMKKFDIQIAVKVDKMNHYDNGFGNDLASNMFQLFTYKYAQYPYHQSSKKIQFESISEGNHWYQYNN